MCLCYRVAGTVSWWNRKTNETARGEWWEQGVKKIHVLHYVKENQTTILYSLSIILSFKETVDNLRVRNHVEEKVRFIEYVL